VPRPLLATENSRRRAKHSQEIERKFGHPGDLLGELQRRIQEDAITRFGVVEADWLRLMWSLDAFRVAGIPPRAMGKQTVEPTRRLAAIYRSKGNWFATILALLLQNRTDQPIRPRTKVQGFSQEHQIDLAWPVRSEDPLVCVETKVTGAPAYGSTPARSAMSDFSNRRKELKFAATDLKLFRRQQETSIHHWGTWREKAAPKTYFLWAARLRTGGQSPDLMNKLVTEAQALVNTYLEGAGLVAWKDRPGGGYQAVALPRAARVMDLDDVLYRIESEIKAGVQPDGQPPPPVRLTRKVVDVQKLEADPEEE